MRENSCRPCGTRSTFPRTPALTCGAIASRPCRDWNAGFARHIFAQNSVLTHTLKPTFLLASSGTTEAVPFPGSFLESFPSPLRPETPDSRGSCPCMNAGSADSSGQTPTVRNDKTLRGRADETHHGSSPQRLCKAGAEAQVELYPYAAGKRRSSTVVSGGTLCSHMSCSALGEQRALSTSLKAPRGLEARE